MILQYRRTLLQYSVVRALTPGFRFTRVQTESEGTHAISISTSCFALK